MAKNSSIDRTRIGTNVIAQIILVAFIIGMLNYLAFNHYWRKDLSRDQKYSLSEQTRRFLGSLQKPVKFTLFFGGGSDLIRNVDALLKEYTYAGKKKVSVEIVDSFLNFTRAREVAAKYKLGANENVVIVDYDGKSKFVNATEMAEYEPSFNPNQPPRLKTFKGEPALTGALIELTEQGANQVYLLSGHGEQEAKAPLLSTLSSYLQRQNVKLAPLKLTDVEIVPPDAKVLAIIGPTYDFSDRDMKLLRAYWEKQGRLFVLLDPLFRVPKLNAFLSEIGIAVNDDQVLTTKPIQVATGIVTGVLREITGDFIPGSPVTKRLGSATATLLGKTQSLTLEGERVKAANIRLKPLIQASPGFWGETNYNAPASVGVAFDPKSDHSNPIVAASAEKGALNDDRVQVACARLIVVGNSTFIRNDAITEADLDFALAGFNWLLNRERMIGITPKTVRNLSLSLTDDQIGYLALLTMGVIPGCAALLGLFVWFKRRH